MNLRQFAISPQTLGYGALFVGSYALFFLLQAPVSLFSRPLSPAPVVPAATPAAAPLIAETTISRLPDAAAQELPAQDAGPGTVREKVHAESRAPEATAPSLLEKNMQRIRDNVQVIGEQAVYGAPRERQSAIVKLGTRVPTPEAVNALYAVLTTDTVVSNRVSAVRSVRQLLLRRLDKDGSLANLLSLAMQDPEPAVANAAHSVSRELSKAPRN